jgi:hypothetical protein
MFVVYWGGGFFTINLYSLKNKINFLNIGK